MKKALIFAAISMMAGCAGKAGVNAPAASPHTTDAPIATDGTAPAATAMDVRTAKSATWIGAAPEGEMLAASTRDTFLGVWVDVPEVRAEDRPPMEIALVIDTSGSMAGEKLDNAKTAASTLVRNMKDGDIVALDTFSEHAETVIPPTKLDSRSREELLRIISRLTVRGSTNMFEGLSLGESQMQTAPASHPLRRIVLISDGIANVGPSSPDTLGMLAERGLRFRAQVTSLGVGNDYDERTLNALSVRSSGRMYHLSDPEQMAKIMKDEVQLLDATLASESSVEIVPAPGVQVVGVDGLRTEWRDGGLRIPLGALHAGQHREALVRVRITDPAMFEGHARSMASVRLRFRDAQENDLERIQEVVARTQLTDDVGLAQRSVNSRTAAIVAINESAKAQLDAAQRINDGDFVDADKELARAQQAIAARAAQVTAPAEKKRLEAAATKVAQSRASAAGAAAKPKAMQRDEALKQNADAMHLSGF